jgi:uncharacterized protein
MRSPQLRRLTSSFALVIALTAIPLTTNAGSCFVWRVTNTTAPCYLVGTLHALRARDYPLPPGYDQALTDSKRLVFDRNPDSGSDYFAKSMRAATYPRGDNLQRHVHPKTWEIINVNFRKTSSIGQLRLGDHVIEHGVEELRPWAIAAIFYGTPGYSDVFYKFGVDNYFAHEGKRKGKELTGLETDDEYLEVLHGMNDTESELMLLNAIVNRDKKKSWNEQLRSAWKRGDIAGMREHFARFGNSNPGAYFRLFDDRNVRWVPRIKEEFNSGKPTSIVVETGHMLGPNGLLALLEHSGYKFEQL